MNRKMVGIFLAVIGLVCFLYYAYWGLADWLQSNQVLDSIIACSISLILVFVGGAVLSALGRKIGFNMAFFGLMGAFWLGLFSYLMLSSVESMAVDNLGEIILGIVVAGLAVVPIPIGVFGLGILSGMLIPHTKVIFNTPPQSPLQPSDEPVERT